MSEFNESKKGSAPKSDIKSGIQREEALKLAGGLPDKKSVEAIDKANSPSARKRAPGSVGF